MGKSRYQEKAERDARKRLAQPPALPLFFAPIRAESYGLPTDTPAVFTLVTDVNVIGRLTANAYRFNVWHAYFERNRACDRCGGFGLESIMQREGHRIVGSVKCGACRFEEFFDAEEALSLFRSLKEAIEED